MTKTILQDVRCSYVYIEDANKKGKYGIQPMIKKGSAQHKLLRKLQRDALVAKHGPDAVNRPGKYKMALRDADEEGHEDESHEGMIFFNANKQKGKPGVLNRAGKKANALDHEEMGYSGCYFHVSVTFFGFEAHEDGGKPGVGVGLNNVMLRKEGPRLDNTVAASDEFKEFIDEDAIGDDDFGSDPLDDDDDWDL